MTPAGTFSCCVKQAPTHPHAQPRCTPHNPPPLQLSAVRRGNIPLATTDHLLVCNWNRQAPLLLRQMATNGHGDSKRLGRQAGGGVREGRGLVSPVHATPPEGRGVESCRFLAAIAASSSPIDALPAHILIARLPPRPAAGAWWCWPTGTRTSWTPTWRASSTAAGCTTSRGGARRTAPRCAPPRRAVKLRGAQRGSLRWHVD